MQWLSEGQTEASLSQRAEDGKTELSLMRFSLAHPQWQPPGHSSKFLGHLRGRVQQDAAAWVAPSTRSPPTPGVLSDCTSPLVSSGPAYFLPILHLSLAFLTLCATLAARLNLSYLLPSFGPPLIPSSTFWFPPHLWLSFIQPEAFLANLLANPRPPQRDLSPTAPCPAAATASLLASISRMAQDPR